LLIIFSFRFSIFWLGRQGDVSKVFTPPGTEKEEKENQKQIQPNTWTFSRTQRKPEWRAAASPPRAQYFLHDATQALITIPKPSSLYSIE